MKTPRLLVSAYGTKNVQNVKNELRAKGANFVMMPISYLNPRLDEMKFFVDEVDHTRLTQELRALLGNGVPMIIKKLVIPREKWGKKRLVLPDGTMCCLGHLSIACGVPPEELASLGYPASSWISLYGVPEVFTIYGEKCGKAAYNAANINDSIDVDMCTGEDRREAKLIALFKEEADIELSFTGVSPPPPPTPDAV